MTPTTNRMSSDNSPHIITKTPMQVVLGVRRIRTEVESYFAAHGFHISKTRIWYNSESAVRSSESFSNRGKPVAYLRFADSELSRPSTPTRHEPVTVKQLHDALLHVREVIPEAHLPEMTLMEESKTIKIGTEQWINDDEIRIRTRRKPTKTMTAEE